MPGCTHCSGENVTECLGCGKGLRLVGSACKSCPSNCMMCSANVCIQCAPNTHLSEDGTQCLSFCRRPCLKCTLEDGRELCSKCLAGYSVVGDGCQPDVNCNPHSNCTVCPHSHVLVSSECEQCEVQEHCSRCSPHDSSVCVQCGRGHFLENGDCVKCSEGCQSCLSLSHCIDCSPGSYKLFANGSEVARC